jgi:long-chain acyl-CoA synthetase
MEKVWLKAYDPGVPESITYPEAPVHQLFFEASTKFAGTTALVHRDRCIDYSELSTAVRSLARARAGLGAGKGTPVGIFLPNLPEMVMSYYAVLATGATAVMLSPALVNRELAQIVGDAGFKMLISCGEFMPIVDDLREEAGLDTVIVLSTEEGGCPTHRAGASDFGTLLSRGGPEIEPPVIDVRNDVAVMIYTGGTTGLPKAVMLTHRAVVANALQLGAWVGLEQGYPTVAALPLFHSYGMSTGMNAALFHGATSVLSGGGGAEDLVDSIERHRVRLLVGVPATIEALAKMPGIRNRDLGSLECCFVGAAPLPKKVRAAFEQVSAARLLEGYGLTEAVTAQSANPLRGVSRNGSIGLPFPDVEFKIVDLETGTRELVAEQVGELVLKSPCLMKGYHNRPADTERALRDGWLYTGDIAWVDHDGYFYVIDRKKEMVTTGVFKAYPAEVEGVINSHEKVKESAVVGHFDDFRGHSLKAFVVPEQGAHVTEQELLDYLKANLSAHKVPRVIEFRDDLPRTEVGKILRKELE